MQEMKYILAIDLGTSGSKTALVSVFGDVADFEFEEVPLMLLPGGGAEQDPDQWWSAIINTSRKLLARKTVPIDDIVAVCCSSQWAGTVAVDKDGHHLLNAIIWMDSRGAEQIKKVTDGPIKIAGYSLGKLIKWLRLTGGVPSLAGKDPSAHIQFIKEKYPDIYKKTYKFLEPKEYVNLRLTGRFASSYDCITLHWVTDNRDLSKIVYNDRLLAYCQLERDKLPDLKRSIDVLGPLKKEVADELGLSPGVQVVMGSPDLQSAAIGSGAVRDYEGHICIGTSSWISAHVPSKKLDLFHAIGSFPCAQPDKYFIINEQETAGKCLTWLRDNILYHQDELLLEEQVPDVYKIFDRIAGTVPAGSNYLLYTPWLYGERTPIDNHLIRGGLYNLSLEHTRADIIRAIFEGVVFNERWSLKYVEKLMGRKLDYLNIVGGGANSDVWCQIHADILNRNIRQVKDPIQANARGAAYIASVGLGFLKFEDISKHIQIQKVYRPNPDHRKIYDELFREFLNIYKNNKDMCARLNKGRH